FHANRDLKPIFLRDLVLDVSHPMFGGAGGAYPNFGVEGEVLDTRPMLAHRAVTRHGVRFNETAWLRKHTTRRQPIAGRRAAEYRPGMALSAAGPAHPSLSSSSTVFRPNRYVQARGLNISFGPLAGGTGTREHKQRGRYARGHVYAEPIVIRELRNQDIKQQFIVGRSVAFREHTIDEEPEL
ncbi:hypothetical protein HK104_002084, partial [Borealophlyctis nickersoniae]